MRKVGITKFKAGIAIASLLSIATICGVLFYNGILHIHRPSRGKFPIQGIDVSEHQGEIDWAQIDRRAVNFVFIKATEGGDFRDRQFQRNWLGAKNAGIARGAYHFFTFCKAGAVQAQNFIDTVPVDRDILPPVIDLEFSGNCQRRLSQVELDRELTAYIQKIVDVYRQPPILYVTNEFYTTYLQSKFTQYPIWISDFYTTPDLRRDERTWLFWQYSERGRVAGIDTLVDLNVFNGSNVQFQYLITGKDRLPVYPHEVRPQSQPNRVNRE
jgi:lysozyme